MNYSTTRKALAAVGVATVLTLGGAGMASAQTDDTIVETNTTEPMMIDSDSSDMSDDKDDDNFDEWGLLGLLGLAGLLGLKRRNDHDHDQDNTYQHTLRQQR